MRMDHFTTFIVGFLCGVAVMVIAVVLAAMTPDDLRELAEEKRRRDRKKYR